MTNTTTKKIIVGENAKRRTFLRMQAERVDRTADLVDRMSENYERDAAIHGEDYAWVIWGEPLLRYGVNVREA